MEQRMELTAGNTTFPASSTTSSYGPIMETRSSRRPSTSTTSCSGKDEKHDQHTPFPTMHINLGVVDKNGGTPHHHCPLSMPTNRPPSSSTSPSDHFGSESHTPTSTRSPSADVSRKQRHNLREQRRILRLGSQFDHLKATLEAAGLITNKKDKHSILQATIEYIAALEYDAHARMTPSSSQPTSISCTYGKKDQHSIPPTSPPISTNDPMDSADLHIRSLRTHPHSIEYLWMPELVADSTASFHQVFLHASVPSAIARLDGSLVHASHLFLQHFPNSMGLSLYGLCVGLPNVHKMQSLVTTIIAGDGRSAQTKMTWQAPGTSPKPVFVSVALVRDATGQPVNIQCTALPMVA